MVGVIGIMTAIGVASMPAVAAPPQMALLEALSHPTLEETLEPRCSVSYCVQLDGRRIVLSADDAWCRGRCDDDSIREAIDNSRPAVDEAEAIVMADGFAIEHPIAVEDALERRETWRVELAAFRRFARHLLHDAADAAMVDDWPRFERRSRTLIRLIDSMARTQTIHGSTSALGMSAALSSREEGDGILDDADGIPRDARASIIESLRTLDADDPLGFRRSWITETTARLERLKRMYVEAPENIPKLRIELFGQPGDQLPPDFVTPDQLRSLLDSAALVVKNAERTWDEGEAGADRLMRIASSDETGIVPTLLVELRAARFGWRHSVEWRRALLEGLAEPDDG